MPLPHVLLGLLADEPKTGYDLARVMRDELDPFWRSEFSQIYPALARLRRAGFVVLRVLGPSRGPPRNLYRVTAAGRRELRRWLSEPFPSPRTKDEGLVRIALLDTLAPSERHSALVRYEKTIAEEVRRLRSAPRSPGYRGEARRGALDRLDAMRRWLRSLGPEGTAGEAGREARRPPASGSASPGPGGPREARRGTDPVSPRSHDRAEGRRGTLAPGEPGAAFGRGSASVDGSRSPVRPGDSREAPRGTSRSPRPPGRSPGPAGRGR